MYITDDEANNRLSSLDNLINRLDRRRLHNGGRSKGRKNDDNDQREAIATTAITHGPTLASEIHNTTISRASLLSNGIITHGLGNDEQLTARVVSKKDKIHEKALDIITASLTKLEPQLEEVNKPRDLAAIAADISKIAERTGPRVSVDESNKPKVQVVIYAPRVRDENEYEIVEVN